MTAAATLTRTVAGGVVAILRADTTRHFAAITESLLAQGIDAIEITLTTPDAVAAVAELGAAFGADALIGAGTVLTAEQADACVQAGARFLVSPGAAPAVVAAAARADVAVYPGAFTPTEVLRAHESGAQAVKLFPASVLGPGFVRDLRGPLPDVLLIPSGGIRITEVADWLRAGAAAVGLGGPLLGRAAQDGPDAQLADRARQVLAAVAEARG
jgi:2-dehydro-3-deoxyphosphogluconate aldolase/(4S)-4-hydroxy-2-oxoglutarate aldolase